MQKDPILVYGHKLCVGLQYEAPLQKLLGFTFHDKVKISTI